MYLFLKLQHAVQEERIQAILNGRRTEGFTPIQSLISIGNNETPPPHATLTHIAHEQPTSPHVNTETPPAPQIIHVDPQQALSPQTETCTFLSTHIHQQQMAPRHTVSNTSSHTNNAHNLQTNPLHSRNRTPSPTHAYQQLQSVVPAGTRTAEPVQQRMPLLTGNRTPLQTWDANSALQSLNAFSPPNNHRQKKGEYVSLLEDDSYELLEMSPPAAAQSNRKRSEDWESFASHFTTEFEALKGEVETLRAEVRQLKRALRDTKVN